jgi:hypothetical protein
MSNLLEIKDRVGRYLREVFNDVRISADGEGYFVPFEGYRVNVTFEVIDDPEQVKWSEENGMPLHKLVLQTWVCHDITPSNEFYKFMVEDLPRRTSIQAFAAVDARDETKLSVSTYQRIAADTIDPNELKFAIRFSVWDSTLVGEELIEKFGAKWMNED